MSTYSELASERWLKGKNVCVGLDVSVEKIPKRLLGSCNERHAVLAFCCTIVDATAEYAFSFKPNIAFFESMPFDGLSLLKEVCDYIRLSYPELPLIIDGKRGDIGNTNENYITEIFDYLGANATTVPPYMGEKSLKPFLDREDVGVFVLCRTSNIGAGEFQDLEFNGEPLYIHVARNVATKWRSKGTLALVVGATYPQELEIIRTVAPNCHILIPGVGSQGGDLVATVEAAKTNFIINASRSIIYASSDLDYANAARDEVKRLQAIISATNT